MDKMNNFLEKSDQELVKLSLENQENFLYLMKRYEKKLIYYILKISNVSYEDAEDLLQEIYIKVYHNLNDYDPGLKFSSWIYRIAHNQVISNYRKLKVRPQSVFWEIEDHALKNLISEIDVQEETDENLLRENIKKVIKTLDKKYRDVLVLRYLEDKDYKEISDILRKPMGTVATLLNKAKAIFKDKIKEQKIKL